MSRQRWNLLTLLSPAPHGAGPFSSSGYRAGPRDLVPTTECDITTESDVRHTRSATVLSSIRQNSTGSPRASSSGSDVGRALRFALTATFVAVTTASGWASDGGVYGFPAPPASLVPVASTVFPVEAAAPREIIGHRVQPWIHPDMPEAMAKKLEAAFEIAVERVLEVPECRGLFLKLGANAVRVLEASLYFPANPRRETAQCRRSVAQSYVGAAPTWFCRNIVAYPDERVAVVVIHEALHHAGLREDTLGREAPSSGSISRTVARACRLHSKKER